MIVINLPHRAGKSVSLICLSAKTGSHIICHSKNECERLFGIAKQMNLNIPYPLTYEEFISKKYYGKDIKSFSIDNADMFLQRLTNVPIEAITVTGRNSFFMHEGIVKEDIKLESDIDRKQFEACIKGIWGGSKDEKKDKTCVITGVDR